MGRVFVLAGLGVVATLAVLPGAVSETRSATTGTCTLAHPELARGFALTGWFDDTTMRPPDFAGLKVLRNRGLAHVRLPILAESVMTRFSPPSAVDARRQEIAAAIDALIGTGFAVVVDLHGGPRLEHLFHADPGAARNAVIQAWTGLGPIVEKRQAKNVSAEVLNEPPLADGDWADMQGRIVAAMRKSMPKTTLIVSTGGPQRVEQLTAAKPIADANTVYAVHYYDPMVFTHQGAEWIRPDPIAWLHDVPFPIRRADPKLAALADSFRAKGLKRVADYLDSLKSLAFGVGDIQRHMRSIGDWSRAHGRTVVIGEFGVYRAHTDPADRRVWLAAVAQAAAKNCLGWTHWEYRDGFGLVDAKSGKVDEATLTALVGPPATGGAAR